MNPETQLLRQAHPQFVPNGQITSQVFFPFPKDDGLLSVDDGDQVTAEAAYQNYTGNLVLESCGVWAVTKAEADGQNVPAIASPELNRPSHSSIDFRQKSEKDCRKIAKRLKAFAVARGCLYAPQPA